MALALGAAALSPVVIGALQLRSHRDALLDQVQRMQILAASTAAGTLAARVEALDEAARQVLVDPDLDNPASAEAQEVLVAWLQGTPELVAAVLSADDGAELLRAQRREYADEIAAVLAADGEADEQIVAVGEQRWLRLRRTSADDRELRLVYDASGFEAALADTGLVGEAQTALLDSAGRLVAGNPAASVDLPEELLSQARSTRLTGGAGRYVDAAGVDLIAAHSPVAGTGWVVLSRQPREAADQARRRMMQTTTLATAGALLVAALLSWLGYRLLIQPMRRLARAQAQFAGVDPLAQGGSEIEQLESTFARLLAIEHDRERIGEVFLGRYQVMGQLGKGGAGTVFRGYDPILKRDVALKTIQLPANIDDANKMVARLQIEAVHAAQLNHPNIVTIHDFERRGDAAYIAMERIDGVSFADYLRALRPLTVEATVSVGLAIARALDVAHGEQLVHGDLKPSNVLLGKDGAIKVADFGTSQILRERGTADASIVGTPGYIAPEVLEGRGSSQEADLFSLGVVLYESLAGRNPFAGGGVGDVMMRTREGKAKPIGLRRPDLPQQLERLIDGLLDSDPEMRPRPASRVADLLAGLQSAEGFVWQPDKGVLERSSDGAAEAETDFLTRYLGDAAAN